MMHALVIFSPSPRLGIWGVSNIDIRVAVLKNLMIILETINIMSRVPEQICIEA